MKLFPRPAPPISAAPIGSGAAVLCKGLSKSFGAVVALDDVSLTIEPNEFFTLLGPSGCGKTTLLRAIAGFVGLDRGSISVYGQRVDGLAPHKRPVNTVFQSYAIFPHMTAAENIAFGLEMDRWPKRRVVARVEEMLELVQLQGLGDRRPAELSGGQQQRVAVARALAKNPRVLLLDEPLSALDQKLRVGMQSELKRLQRETGITFIFVTPRPARGADDVGPACGDERRLHSADRLAAGHLRKADGSLCRGFHRRDEFPAAPRRSAQVVIGLHPGRRWRPPSLARLERPLRWRYALNVRGLRQQVR